MSIANKVFSDMGARTFAPIGPLGTNSQFPFPDFDFGEVVEGEKEAEFVYLMLGFAAATTLNQGDVLCWDDSYTASVIKAGVNATVVGSGVGTFWLGGRVGDPAGAPNAGNAFSYTFQPGVYGVWAQRAGGSILNVSGGVAAGQAYSSTTTAGALAATATPATNAATIPNLAIVAPSVTFTATTTTGSNILTAVSGVAGLVKGMAVSATNLSPGCVISDIQGPTVTLSNRLNSAGPNATATGSAQTITAYNGSMWATFATASKAMNVDGIYGVYPNATLTGTGVGASSVLSTIVGNPGNYSATVTVNSSAAETTPVLVTATKYVEGMLRWPYISAQS